jgi:hypothetical protein
MRLLTASAFAFVVIAAGVDFWRRRSSTGHEDASESPHAGAS